MMPAAQERAADIGFAAAASGYRIGFEVAFLPLSPRNAQGGCLRALRFRPARRRGKHLEKFFQEFFAKSGDLMVGEGSDSFSHLVFCFENIIDTPGCVAFDTPGGR